MNTTTEPVHPLSIFWTELTQDRLKQLLDYDPITGLFTWKVTVSSKAKAGDIAGSEDSKGYIKICIRGTRYGGHQLAWFYVHGEWIMPDHEDNIPSNNAINNLRKATYSQNNHRKYTYNPHGYRGVRFRSGFYQAHIRIDGRITLIGKFNSAKEAGEAYAEAARKHYGEFAQRIGETQE